MPNTAQLKDAIDSGKTGDKIAFPDPAAAPLGTDDEAAGTPPTPEQVRTALANEYRPRPATASRGAAWAPMVLVLVVAVIGALLLTFLLR
jgi:hypothetical protein